MSIKKFIAVKDNTITNAFEEDLSTRAVSSSMGASDVLEIFSIYNQATEGSVERSRVILEFPVNKIQEQRSSGLIPAVGSVKFFLNLRNVIHSETLANQSKISISPLLQSWSEGTGLDMETYTDKGASNWISSSVDNLWNYQGGSDTTAVESVLNSPSTIYNHIVDSDKGTEDILLDMTSLVEDWLKHEAGTSASSTATINLTGETANGSSITLRSTDGDSRKFIFSDSSKTENKNVYFVNVAGNTQTTRTNLLNAIVATNLFTATSGAGSSLSVTQSVKGRFGDTKIESSNATITKVDFANGAGVVNNGVLVKLSGSFESGANKRSYYTKRLSSRTSEYSLKRPSLEARFDLSIKDDRLNLITANPALSNAQNEKTIYYHNYVNGVLTDLETSPKFILAVDQALTTSAVFKKGTNHNATGSGANAEEITSDKVSNTTGIYSATFKIANNTNKTFLYEKWFKTDGTLLRGHPNNPITVGIKNYYDNINSNLDSQYLVNITNLKSSYTQQEQVRFRLYTRRKTRKPNIYTVASKKASVDNIKDGWYKISRVVDNFEIIGYSTGSSPSYSSLSYDVSGSYFDLDMSLLEKGYLYEISFLRKDQSRYIEIQDKFKFRVD
tara:strand:- start:22393 stop:24240 length:1848 start_codon:yes stop_codon:yes gene_type:complete